MADEFVPKTQAVLEVMQVTGRGRQVVEKKIVELETRGQISFENDPGDTRKKLIRRSQVELIIASLSMA